MAADNVPKSSWLVYEALPEPAQLTIFEREVQSAGALNAGAALFQEQEERDI